jgi:hypothetical protein
MIARLVFGLILLTAAVWLAGFLILVAVQVGNRIP